jgi:hypothetical protein
MKENKNLNEAVENAKDYSLAGVPTAVYQVGADSFVVTCTPLTSGTIVGIWMNGVNDGRYSSMFTR